MFLDLNTFMTERSVKKNMSRWNNKNTNDIE